MKDLTDNLLTCKIDGESFETEKELHKHLRKHKIRIAEYYQKYYPRYDKHDGKMIKFKMNQPIIEILKFMEMQCLTVPEGIK